MLRNFAKTSLILGRQDALVAPFFTLKTSYASAAAAANVNVGLKSYDEIPGPRTWPLFGSMLSAKEFGKHRLQNGFQIQSWHF